ncbi:cation efflux system protein [Streptococcus pneumoniae]|nr:cation efflux system protein [Streptococcus pneumoniae]CJG25667.1 cation efflux system protein [Streptococcus pneumoniae]CRC94810.1 cation efflux system protein [Streptococcus pneumoniae]CRD31961.1 cation efflux system protein [Streptococcus pneumoniae]CRD35696.1 cation efflux system protein [Streptococcus pneumoniae]
MPEGLDIKQVKSGLERLDNVASLNQLNLWTMDALEKNAIVHVCLKEMEHMETCKESIRIFLKDCGFQNITIEIDADLETHQTHKRKVCDLERSYEHQH